MKKILIFLFTVFITLTFIFKSSNVNAITFDIDFDTETNSIYLVNLDTNAPIYEKNADTQRAIGGLVKIMTYIVTCEQIKDLENTKVTIKEDVINLLRGTGSALSGFKDGEEVTILQLLYCLMVSVGNDAALILADYIGDGDINKFVDMMNEKAKDLGCTNTNFANPTGLYHENNYSTAKDVYIMSNYALSLPYFNEIVNTKFKYIFSEDDGRYVVTTNYMIDRNRGGDYYYKYASGIKSGSDGKDSGYCVVSTAENNGFAYMCVSLGAATQDSEGNQLDNMAMKESAKIYDWAFRELDIRTIMNTKNSICEVPVELAWNKDTLLLLPANNFSMLLPSYINSSNINYSVNIPKSVRAPINEGDAIGTVTLKYNGSILTTIDLVASESIERSELLYNKEFILNIVTSKWFFLAIGVIILLIIIYIIYAIIKNKKRRNQQKYKVKKYRNL